MHTHMHTRTHTAKQKIHNRNAMCLACTSRRKLRHSLDTKRTTDNHYQHQTLLYRQAPDRYSQLYCTLVRCVSDICLTMISKAKDHQSPSILLVSYTAKTCLCFTTFFSTEVECFYSLVSCTSSAHFSMNIETLHFLKLRQPFRFVLQQRR